MDNYIVVEHFYFHTLVEQVNAKLEQGYVCLGGICVNNNHFYQAMILQEAPTYRACP